MLASYVYRLAVIAIGVVLVTGGIVDLVLAICNKTTVTDWLLDNMIWYYLPALLMLLFLAGLGIHLFLCKVNSTYPF